MKGDEDRYEHCPTCSSETKLVWFWDCELKCCTECDWMETKPDPNMDAKNRKGDA